MRAYTIAEVDRIRAAEGVRCALGNSMSWSSDIARTSEELSRFQAIEDATRTDMAAGLSADDVETAADHLVREVIGGRYHSDMISSPFLARARAWAKTRGIAWPEGLR